MSYEVEVTREGDAWLADVVGVAGAHTYARNLASLDANVREVIALVEDLDDEAAIDVRYTYGDTDALVREAAAVGAMRAALEDQERDLQARMASAVVGLSTRGMSVRDIASLVRVSPGRISQIVPRRKVS